MGKYEACCIATALEILEPVLHRTLRRIFGWLAAPIGSCATVCGISPFHGISMQRGRVGSYFSMFLFVHV